MHKDFDLMKILPKTSLNDDSVFGGDEFIKLLERLISCLTVRTGIYSYFEPDSVIIGGF